jgi:FtsZ-binding cell division protein ZapB
VLNAEILVAREAATEDGRRVEAMQTEIAEMETTRDRARAEAQAAQDAAEALRRADAERRAQGLLVRLRAAWQGR